MAADDTDARLAVLTSQLHAMATTMERVEKKVDDVVSLDRTIAGLQSDYRHQINEVATQWKKIDANEANIDVTDRKVEKWINTARGMTIVMSVVISLIQTAVGGALAWGFTNLSAERARGDLQDYRLQQLEQKLKITQPTERDQR